MLIIRIQRKCLINVIKDISRRSYCSAHASTSSGLTSCEELNQLLQNPKWYQKLRVLDARWDLDEQDYRDKHTNSRIPCSKFFSFDECRDTISPFSRMLPTSADFSAYVSNLGISNHHHVVIYDHHEKIGSYSSPRVWWMFRAFGHDKVSILDGGFGKWLSDGYPSVSGPYTDKEKDLPNPKQPFLALKKPKLLMEFETVKKNALSSKPIQALDARGLLSFSEQHIPQSFSTPNTELFNEDRTLKSKDELRELFREKNIDLNSDIFTTCGSGVTACIVAHALYTIGKEEVSVYDGSMSEWKVRAPHLLSSDIQ